jgi:hypothetical protein
MNEDKIQEAVLYAIKELQKDYTNNLLCHEWSLQSALYMHLRNYLDNQKDGKKIWCELRLKTGIIWKRKEKKFIKKKEQVAVDIGIVNINENKEDHLKNSITEVHALIEIKYVQMSANAKEQFKKKISGNKKTWTKVAELLYKDILKLNKLQWCCMNMSNEDLIEKHAPSIYFIACIEDSKTYKEEFMVIKNWELISEPN